MRLPILLILASFFLFSPFVSAAEGVPFTPQAPFGDWDDPRQQEGCEEASILMAMHWVTGEPLSRTRALKEILELSAFEEEHFGVYLDTSAKTTTEILKAYFDYDHVELFYDITPDDIIDQLDAGHVVVAPMDGRALQNPNFTPPGPLHHMIIFHGYDAQTKEFITHDPGTRNGENYRYSYTIIANSLRDYPDGSYEEVEMDQSAMIVVKKENPLVSSLQGKVLLQVEDKGQAYYIPPRGTGLFFLGRPFDTFTIMREQGEGISNENLLRIPIGLSSDQGVDSDGDGISDRLEHALGLNSLSFDTDSDGFNDMQEIQDGFSPWESDVQLPIDMEFAGKQKGKIFLQVEQNGEAWYINPDDSHRYYLGTPTDAFQIIRKLALGISNNDFFSIFSYFKNLFQI